MHNLHDDIERILIDEATLQQRVRDLGAAISEQYASQDLLLISVLKGSIIFMADLVRSITIPHEIDFMATSSYGAGTSSSGVVRILKDLNMPIEGRNVVLVEDIIDSGNTLSYLVRILQERNPASLRIMTLLDKPDRREVEIEVDWTGFAIPNDFVVGYGLDYAEHYRNLAYIGVLKPHVYAKNPPDLANPPDPANPHGSTDPAGSV
ncbi:MAG: hypoxanthine phosphoribosyltransferase [Caldilineaceae bacterium]|nr:hypoxanthine phosphoribosyltransferase [Caldilineaceae bacterium]